MFQRIPLLLLLLISTISSAARAQDATQTTPQPLTLKAGTDVTLRLVAQFSPKHANLGNQVAFTTVWPLKLGTMRLWNSGTQVTGTVTSLTPSPQITLQPIDTPAGQVKFASRPFEVMGYGSDRTPPPPPELRGGSRKTHTFPSADNPLDAAGAAVGGTILLGAFAVGETGHFIAHPFGGSSKDPDRGIGTVTVVKVAEDVTITAAAIPEPVPYHGLPIIYVVDRYAEKDNSLFCAKDQINAIPFRNSLVFRVAPGQYSFHGVDRTLTLATVDAKPDTRYLVYRDRAGLHTVNMETRPDLLRTVAPGSQARFFFNYQTLTDEEKCAANSEMAAGGCGIKHSEPRLIPRPVPAN